MKTQEHILVIKHGALGDMVLATGPMQAIRTHHPQAHITLLTTQPYAVMAKESGLFDEVVTDSRPRFWQLGKWFSLFRFFHRVRFDRIYDLQTSRRSSFYYRLFLYRPQWSGIARGSSHRHRTPQRTLLHTIDRHREQLSIAGIFDIPPPAVPWLKADISHFKLKPDFALLVPGGSSHRPEKRWPAPYFIEVIRHLKQHGIQPVLLGTEAEEELLGDLTAGCPIIQNLCGKTSFAEIAELGRQARFALGNDTGPMHLLAAAGCPSIVLFSHASDPNLCAPRGDHVTILRERNLSQLPPWRVIERLQLQKAA